MPATDSLQTRKLCSAYGGVGSLIESRLGALRILSASDWPYVVSNRVNREENRLNDDRLLARLRSVFTELRRIARMPYNRPLAFAGAVSPPRVLAEYFPKWMYCPGCARFDHFDNWRRQWYNTVAGKPQADKNRFDEQPRCDYCYHKHTGNGRYQALEQVRFVMTSPAGSLADVPWPHWALYRHHAAPTQPDGTAEEAAPDDTEESGKLTLDLSLPLPDGLELYYRTSGRYTDLKGIRIEARYRRGAAIESHSATLSGLFNLRVPEPDLEGYRVRDSDKDYPQQRVQMKPVLRASNSVYYPHIVQSLFLPGKQPALVQPEPAAQGPGINGDIAADLQKLDDFGFSAAEILDKLFKKHQLTLSEEEFAKLKADKFQLPKPSRPLPAPSEPGEEDYRRAEYAYLTLEAATASAAETNGDLLAREVDWSAVPGMSLGLQLDRLKMTSVQTSYTRQQPLDRDAFLAKDEAGSPLSIRRRYTTRYKLKTHTLLGVESYGEGLFFTLDPTLLRQWEQRDDVRQHVQQQLDNQLRLPAGSPGAARAATPRLVLLHTLSHLLIKELEFLCGYPATSLQERLYVGAGMQGFLLYTIAGSEGSYGGLVSLGRQGKLPGLLRSALHRATDCPADPICWHTDQSGQGVGGLNLAACASCALLPETSCEEFNSLLDRRLVVDSDFGYFKELLKGVAG